VVHPPSRVDGSIHSLVLSDRQTNLGWHFSVYNNKTYDRQTLALYVRWKSCPYSGSVAVWTPDPGPRTPDHTTSRLDEFRLPKDTGNQKSHRSDFVDTIQCDTGRRPIRLCPLKKKWPPTKTPTVRRSSHDASDLRCSGIVGMIRTPPQSTPTNPKASVSVSESINTTTTLANVGETPRHEQTRLLDRGLGQSGPSGGPPSRDGNFTIRASLSTGGLRLFTGDREGGWGSHGLSGASLGYHGGDQDRPPKNRLELTLAVSAVDTIAPSE